MILDGVNGTAAETADTGATVAKTGSVATLETMLLGAAGGNDSLKTMVEAMIEERGSFKNFKIIPMDKNRFKLGFDTVAMIYQGSNGIYAEVAVLEATGRAPLPAKQILEAHYTHNYVDTLTTVDAFGDLLTGRLNGIIESSGFDAAEVEYLGGVIIPSNADVVISGRALYRRVHDVMLTKDFENGEGNKIELADIAKDKQFSLQVGYNLTNAPAKSILGNPVKNDFRLDLSTVSTRGNGGTDAIHNLDATRKMVSTAGRVDYIVSEEINRFTGVMKKIAQPMVIITDTVSNVPTLGHVLMGVANAATAFANRATMRNLIVQADAGPLNMLFNFGGEANKLGEKISFADQEADPQVINEIIREHIVPQPIFAIETALHDEDFSIAAPLSALGGGVSPEALTSAEKILRDTVREFTGRDIRGRIIEGSSVIVPKGYFMDNAGEQRDIAEILDTTFVAQHASDIQLVYDAIFSNLPREICQQMTGKDNYSLKLEILTKLAASLAVEPIITGRSVRVVLNGEFVAELVGAMNSCGYTPQVVDPSAFVGIDANLQNLSAIYANAHVQNMPQQGYGYGAQQGMYGMPQQGYGMPQQGGYGYPMQ